MLDTELIRTVCELYKNVRSLFSCRHVKLFIIHSPIAKNWTKKEGKVYILNCKKVKVWRVSLASFDGKENTYYWILCISRYAVAAQNLVMAARGRNTPRGWRISKDGTEFSDSADPKDTDPGSYDDISVFVIPLSQKFQEQLETVKYPVQSKKEKVTQQSDELLDRKEEATQQSDELLENDTDDG